MKRMIWAPVRTFLHGKHAWGKHIVEVYGESPVQARTNRSQYSLQVKIVETLIEPVVDGYEVGSIRFALPTELQEII